MDKGDRERNRREHDEKFRRLKILGADRRDRGAITPKHPDGFWKKPYATDKETADERSDATPITSRKHERDCVDRTDSGVWSSFSKNFRSDKDGSERVEHPWKQLRRSFGHDRDGLSPRKTFTSSDATGLKAVVRKEVAIDWTVKTVTVNERDGFGREEGGRFSVDKAYLKEGIGSERSGRSEAARKSSRDCLELSKAPSKKAFGVSRDVSGRTDTSKLSPRGRDHFKRESERFSHGKRQERDWSCVEAAKLSPGEERESFYREPSLSQEREEIWPREDMSSPRKIHAVTSSDEVDKNSWQKNNLKILGRGQDKLEEWEAQRHGGKQIEKGGLCKRSLDNNTSAIIRSPDTEGDLAKLHIVKRLRSGREKLKRDYAASHNVLKETVLEAVCGVEREADGTGKSFSLNVSPDTAEEEGEAIQLTRVKGAGNEGLDGMDSPADVQNAAEKENQQSGLQDSKIHDTSSGSIRKSEMEEGELDPEDDAVESSERMEEHVETAPCAIVKTANSDDKVEHITEAEHVIEENDEQQDENFGRKEKVENSLLQQKTDEVVSRDSLNEGKNERGTVEQSTVDTSGICQEHERAIDFQKEQPEIHGICKSDLVSERNSDCRTFARVPLDLNEKNQEHMGLTLDLLFTRAPAGELKEASEGPPRAGTKDIQRESDESSKELSLSLSMKSPVAEPKYRDNRFEGRKKEISTSGATLNEKEWMVNSKDLAEASCERQTQKGQKYKPFYLSLALPDVRLASPCSQQMPGSPELDITVQSFGQTYTNSDGFTTSLSFSHSHPFIHNPSCSLTHTSFDNQEFSCGSQQISQGNEMSHGSWQAAFRSDQVSYGNYSFAGISQDRMKHRQEVSLYQKLLQSGNAQACQNISGRVGSKGLPLNERVYEKFSSNQVCQGSQISQKLNTVQKNTDSRFGKVGEIGKSMLGPIELDRLQQEVRLVPAQSTGSQEIKADSYMQPGIERPARGSNGIYSVKDENAVRTKGLGGEKLGLLEIVTEPVAIMARKLQELPESFHDGLKDSLNDMLRNIEKRGEFIDLQNMILRRTDLTHETLLRADRTQLELLLALKTGMQAFLHPQCRSLTDKALIEIFLHKRCRNFCCQASLPVDGCECRICSQKSGFCNACMCVVCSKFDIEGETCRWIGCDYCMHWCHTNCGIQEYIVPGSSIQGTSGTSGMQYNCIACGCSCELYGFVKEVFTKFVNQWSAEALAKELDCVRRIFHASQDMKGKQLCWKVEESLQKLENGVDVREVSKNLIQFFKEGNTEVRGSGSNAAKLVNSQGVSDHVVDALWDVVLKSNPNTGNKVADLDKGHTVIQSYGTEFEEKKTEDIEVEYERARKQAGIDELERASRIKHAEAKMFQLRADDARQAAEALQQIVLAKNEKIDEDYTCKVGKLRLNDAEDRRRKRLEELLALERAQQEYQSMKSRMEVDIKDLLKKMEAAKRQLV